MGRSSVLHCVRSCETQRGPATEKVRLPESRESQERPRGSGLALGRRDTTFIAPPLPTGINWRLPASRLLTQASALLGAGPGRLQRRLLRKPKDANYPKP